MHLHEAMTAAKMIAEESTFEGIASRFLDAITGEIALQSVCFDIVDAQPKRLHLVEQRGLPTAVACALGELPVDDETLAGRAVTAGAFVSLDARAGASSRDVRTMGSVGCAWALPLVSSETTLGVVEALSAHILSPEDREVVADLADVAAASIARCVRRADRELRRVFHANTAIVDALSILPPSHMHAAVARGFQLWPTPPDMSLPESLHRVLKVIVREARRMVGAEMAALGIGNSPDRPFDPWVSDGVSVELEKALGRHPRPIGTLGVVATEGRVVRVPRLKEDPAFAGFPSGHPAITSLLGVPIRYGSQSLGSLYLANKIGAAEFSEGDEQAIEVLVTHVALALQQTYLRSAVEAHQAHLHSILESAPHGILFLEAGTERAIANSRAMQLLGGALDPQRGHDQYAELLRRPDGRPIALESLPSRRALRGEQPEPAELLIVRPDGVEVSVIERSAPVLGFESRLLGAVVSLEDLTPFKELERRREEFAAMIVHDLRGPVQAILIQTDLLASREHLKRPEMQHGLCRIKSNACHLERMANDLLDTTRIELHQLSLATAPVPLARAVKQIVDRIAPALGSHEVRLTTPGPLPDVALDLNRFDHALSNLLDNAARHSPPDAPIDVRIAQAFGGLVLSVENSGTCMVPEELDHAFERFYQSKGERARKAGLGVGLYICKCLVEAHGGRIWGESKPGEGMIFHVWLPSYATEPAHPCA